MPNPFAALQPVLRVLTEESRVLPATGQAIIDLVRPDLDEGYDRAIGGKDETIRTLWETPRRQLYVDVLPIPRREQHVLRHFLDGSTRTYFIGTVLEHQRSSPVQLAQVGAACVSRDDDGMMRVSCVEHKVLLMLDSISLSNILWDRLQDAAQAIPNFELRSTATNDPLSTNLGINDPRSRGAHKANWAMREIEVHIARERLHRSDQEWLVIDGALGNEYLDWRGAPLIGVAKSFRRDVQFHFGSGPRAKEMNLYGMLAGLGVSQRTAVFSRWPGQDQEGKILFWYVRIRPQRGLDYPLMGVVKVEIPNPDRQPIDSDLVDFISGALVAERSVTPHGSDSRWHAHLYPISVAEHVIKNQFYSQEVLKAAIRWPELGISV
jgi:hypothetical protein